MAGSLLTAKAVDDALGRVGAQLETATGADRAVARAIRACVVEEPVTAQKLAVAGALMALSLSELGLGADTPAVVWACWRHVVGAAGHHLRGEPSPPEALRVLNRGRPVQVPAIELARLFLHSLVWGQQFSDEDLRRLQSASTEA